MTREEASNILDDYDVNFDGYTAEEIAKAFDVAFKALEQELCEDCVSKQAVINVFYIQSDDDGWWTGTTQDVEELLNSLQPTQPKPKTGKWIQIDYQKGLFECSECHTQGHVDTCMYKPLWKYCPNCGAKMVESQESEVKDANND